jgi:hypothetical protein
MNFLTRPTSFLRSAALRPALSTIPRARQQVRFATQDYGSGAGNPAGETPEKQGKNPSEHLEHPGPPPPKVARGQSSSSPDNDQSENQDGKASSSGKSSVEPGQQSQSNDGASKQGSNTTVKGAQPKILNENPPAKDANEDVKAHNQDMDQRAEKSHEQVSNEDAKNDKVPKKFWAGM